jgi:hypothetical protein
MDFGLTLDRTIAGWYRSFVSEMLARRKPEDGMTEQIRPEYLIQGDWMNCTVAWDTYVRGESVEAFMKGAKTRNTKKAIEKYCELLAQHPAHKGDFTRGDIINIGQAMAEYIAWMQRED